MPRRETVGNAKRFAARVEELVGQGYRIVRRGDRDVRLRRLTFGTLGWHLASFAAIGWGLTAYRAMSADAFGFPDLAAAIGGALAFNLLYAVSAAAFHSQTLDLQVEPAATAPPQR